MKNLPTGRSVHSFATTFAVVFFLLCLSYRSSAQSSCHVNGDRNAWSEMYSTPSAVYHTDTTFYSYAVDTIYSGAHYSPSAVFTWAFSDSMSYSGFAITRPFTGDVNIIPNISYTLTVVDTALGCTASYSFEEQYPQVFNCSRFRSYTLPPVVDPSIMGYCGHVTGSAARFPIGFNYYNAPFPSTLRVNWGNGDTISQPALYTGGVSYIVTYDYTHAGAYQANYVLTIEDPYTHAACVLNGPTVAFAIEGNVRHPAISGTISICEGDTLRLTAHDTTSGINSFYFSIDTVGASYVYDFRTSSAAPLFGWSRALFTGGYPEMFSDHNDSVLVIPHASLRDTAFVFARSYGCEDVADTIRINVTPSSLPHISGHRYLCSGLSYSFSNAVTGGTWTTDQPSIASVNPTTGVVTAISAGDAMIRYSLGAGCPALQLVTVDAAHFPIIRGTATLAPGATTALSDSGSYAIWASNNPSVASIDASGNVYAGTVGDAIITMTIFTGCDTIVDSFNIFVTNSLIHTIAGNTHAGFSGDGYLATTAQLNNPGAIASDSSSNIYFYDNANFRIRKVTRSGTISTIAGTGTSGYSGDGGPATAADVHVSSLACDRNGNVYFSDNTANVIRKVSSGGVITTIAGTGSAGYSGDGGSASGATLNTPIGICVDWSGNLLVCDNRNYVVRKIDNSGIISTIAGNGTGTDTGDNCAATAAGIASPASISTDSMGNVYFMQANKIRKISPTGTITTLLNSRYWSSSADGDGRLARSNGPESPLMLAADRWGNVYFSHWWPMVFRINRDGFINRVAGNTDSAHLGDGGLAVNARIDARSHLACDYAGNLYISQMTDDIIRKVDVNRVDTGTVVFSGYLYHDENTNCSFDTSETPLPYWAIAVVNNTAHDTTFTWCNSEGRFSANLIAGNSYSILPDYYSSFGIGRDSLTLICPSAGAYAITPVAAHTYTQDFGFSCHGSVTTLDMNVAGFGSRFAPTRTTTISIWASNSWGYMCDSVGARVTFQLASNLSYLGMSSGPTPTSVSGHTLTWDFGTRRSLLDFNGVIAVTPASGAHAGDTVTNTIHVNPIGLSDPDTTDNTYTWSTIIRGSYDPNELEVSPIGYGSAGYVKNETPLSYMVHFQNTGTDTAYNVFILDTLDNNLNIATLQLINSSHDVAISQVGTSNVVKFTFSDIYLPDSTTNLAASNGFVSFNISPMADLAPNTALPNTAHIYFDANPAVATNTVINTIEDTIGMISGASSVCAGSSTTLTNHVSGGTWTATNGHATVTGGIVTGVSVGVDTITYSLYGGEQMATKVITVNSLPSAGTLSGITTVCAGATTTLSSTVTGGTWSSSSASTASVSGGVVTGAAAGSATISYYMTTSCGTDVATAAVTVNPLPTAGTITGTTTVCAGATTTLSAATGGTWSSASASTASVSTTGVVTGVAAGGTTISYSVTNGCGTDVATASVTVNPLPSAGTLSGTTTVCAGATTTLSSTATGGSWSSSAASTASVSGGVVTGAAAGSATISYSMTNSCGTDVASVAVTVNPLPSAGTITGTTSVCAGATTTLGAATGGTWSSSTVTIASVSSSGVVTGILAGTTLVSYSVTNSCGTDIATTSFTVNPLPSAGSITGTTTVCVAATTALADAVTGGTWSSGAASIASVSSAGIVRGMAAGSTMISYSVTNSCGTDVTSVSVTVNPLPSAGTITGITTVCVAASTALSAATGGSWSSASSSVASVSSTGVVSGIAAGSTTISYSVTNGCGTDVATASVTVNPLPSAGALSGTTTVCAGATTTLSSTVTGGSWSSSAASTASVSGGVVTGVAAGSATISYSMTNSCGTDIATAAVTVNPLPVAGTITGPDSVCVGSAITLGATGSSGTTSTWTMTNTSATISGTVVTGAFAGTDTAIHISSNSCGTVYATKIITVMPLPDPGTITGADSVCAGSTITLTESVTGGTWSITGTSATVASGVVTGVSAGTSSITYSVTNYCGTGIRVHPVVTNPLPVAGSLSGTTAICVGGTTTITPSVAGGTWTSSITTTATVDAAGLVTGVAAGVVTISYTVTNSCGSDIATTSVTINPPPVAGSISGLDSVCVGDTIVLTDGVTGGAWSSSNTSIATVSGTGGVMGIASGSATITYNVTNTCGSASATHNVYVKSIADCNTGVSSQQLTVSSPGVYPNPNNGSFVVDIPTNSTNVTIIVTDVSGKVISRIQPKNASGLQVPIELGDVARGTYLLNITIDGKSYHDKVIVW